MATSRHYYGFLISNENFNSWEINAPAAIHRKVGHLLREMNLLDGNRELPFDQLKSEKWKKPARELWTTLTDSSKTNLFDGLKELIIVPDGSLWYVPFAALQVGPDGKSEPLVSKVRLRMAPLVSMTLQERVGVQPRPRPPWCWGNLRDATMPRWHRLPSTISARRSLARWHCRARFPHRVQSTPA